MKKNKIWAIIGFFFILLLGALLHFTVQWSGIKPGIGVFTPINESIWESTKLLFWPALLFYFVELIFGERKNFIRSKMVSLFAGPLFMIAAYYTYTGIIGARALWADLIIFVLSVFTMQYMGYSIAARKKEVPLGYSIIAILLIIILVVAFVVFTFITPDIPLFLG